MIGDLVGIPYRKNGRGMDGMDCYGLMIEVYRRLGVDVKDWLSDWKGCAGGIKAVRLGRPEKHCAVVFDGGAHVGVCLGYGKFIHSREGHGVVVESLSGLEERIEGYYKLVP